MKQLATILWLLLAAVTHGQTMNDRSEATCKANKAWLEKCWQQGVVARIPCGTLYLRDVAETPVTVGCGRMATNGSGGYWIPADHPTLAGKTSRIQQLTPCKPALRLRGAGFICLDPLYIEGQGDCAAIEVEGRQTGVATGHHRFANACFYNWKQCFKALAGYYKDGQFIADENHADNTHVDCVAFNCDTIFRSENQQAVNWRFSDTFWQGTTKNGTAIAFDIQRGGSLTVDGLTIENSKFTLFRLKDFSPNNSRLDARIWIDTMLDPKPNFCWVEYVGDPVAATWSEWGIDIRGFVGTQNIPIESHTQYKNCDKLPKQRWRVSIDHVKQGAK